MVSTLSALSRDFFVDREISGANFLERHERHDGITFVIQEDISKRFEERERERAAAAAYQLHVQPFSASAADSADFSHYIFSYHDIVADCARNPLADACDLNRLAADPPAERYSARDNQKNER